MDLIYKFFGMILSFFNNITQNYLLAVMLFALLFKIILFPFSIKQQKNSVKQASLRPKEQAIRKKYKGRDDQNSKNKMNAEIQEMYQAEGYSPFSGCLPMLLQLPILLILYQVIRQPISYICGLDISKCNEALIQIGAITDNMTDELQMVGILRENLSAVSEIYTDLANVRLPNFSIFGLNLAPVPLNEIKGGGWGLMYLLIPVLTFVFMYGSMKIQRRFTYQPEQDPSMGCSMKVMDLAMPLMSTYISAIWPSIMGVYWMFNNVLGVVQQFVLHKMYPLPVLTEEDYKNAERQLRGKAPKYTATSDPRVIEGKQYRSLHHIDDEDSIPESKLPPMKIDLEEDDRPPENAPILKEDKPDRKKKKNK